MFIRTHTYIHTVHTYIYSYDTNIRQRRSHLYEAAGFLRLLHGVFVGGVVLSSQIVVLSQTLHIQRLCVMYVSMLTLKINQMSDSTYRNA